MLVFVNVGRLLLIMEFCSSEELLKLLGVFSSIVCVFVWVLLDSMVGEELLMI